MWHVLTAIGSGSGRRLNGFAGRARWSTFGCGMSAFGRTGDAHWDTFAFGYGMSAFGRPGDAHWDTFAFGYGMSAFGRPGGAHAVSVSASPRALTRRSISAFSLMNGGASWMVSAP